MQFKTTHVLSKPLNTTHPNHNEQIALLDQHMKWANSILNKSNNDPQYSTKYRAISTDYDHAGITHAGFANYIYRCWQQEYGVLLRPDILWHLVISELASEIVDHPKEYKYLYSDTEEKQKITVNGGGTGRIDLDGVISGLKDKILNKDFCEVIINTRFESQPDNFAKVMAITFAYSATPYFDFETDLCGIPHVEVTDSIDDWLKLYNNISKLKSHVTNDKMQKYFDKVSPVINDIIYHAFGKDKAPNKCAQLKHTKITGGTTFSSSIFGDDDDYTPPVTIVREYTDATDFFTEMFRSNVRCGSGHDHSFEGWILNMYKYKYTTIDSFPCHVNYIPYHDKVLDKSFYEGIALSYSIVKNNTFVPYYGSVVHEIVDKETFTRIRN